MSWQKWVLVGWMSWGVLACIATIGKPRRPLTPRVACVILVVNAAAITLVVTA